MKWCNPGSSDWRFMRTVAFALCFVALGSCTPDRGYDENTARVLAHTYALDNPGSVQEMEAFVNANRRFFDANGSAIQAMRSLGGKLTQAGTNAFDPQALGRASRTGGPPELAQDVARKMNGRSTELVCMGQELAWLAAVLPYAAQGEWGPYLGTRPLCRGLTHGEAIAKLNQLRQIIESSGDPQLNRMYQLLMAQVQVVMPLTEQEMFLMAIMYAD